MPSSSPERFTLLPGNWYAAEFLGDEYGPENDCRSFSPIRVLNVEPMAERRLSLTFYHANYPEGVRDKTYLLATIQRARGFLLARCLGVEQDRLLLVYGLTGSWLRERFDFSFEELEGQHR